MKTVIRNDQGEITHVHYHGRYYLKNATHKLVNETSINTKMVNNAIKDPLLVLKRIVNNDGDTAETIKLYVMMKNGFDIVLYDYKGDAIDDIELLDL